MIKLLYFLLISLSSFAPISCDKLGVNAPVSVAKRVFHNVLLCENSSKACYDAFEKDILVETHKDFYAPWPQNDESILGITTRPGYKTICERGGVFNLAMKSAKTAEDIVFSLNTIRDMSKNAKFKEIFKDNNKATVKVTYRGQDIMLMYLIKGENGWKVIINKLIS